MSAESYDAESMPADVTRRMFRRTNAEQDRYMNLAKLADATDKLACLAEKVVEQNKVYVPPAPAPTLRALLRHWFGRLLF